jgi:hypothetical protein
MTRGAVAVTVGWRALVCALIALIALLPLRLADATAYNGAVERALERRVKAAFIYRFTDFISWPDAAFSHADAPFTIAAIARGHEMADELLQAVTGRMVAGRRISVEAVKDGERPEASQLIFIAHSERHRLSRIVRTAPPHALIVTETPDALSQGSVLNFVIVEGRVRFEVSLTAAERRGLKVSSRLLAVAYSVHQGSH